MNPYEEIERRASSSKSLEESAEVFEILLSGGFSVWEDGSLYNIKQLVAQVNGLRIEVYSREHPPPHFHISGGGIDATFTITECLHLEGKIGHREKALIEWWSCSQKTHQCFDINILLRQAKLGKGESHVDGQP